MKQRYVIVRKQVFRWEEKAPFVVSGKSIEGGLEYDLDADKIKCHGCGKWYRALSKHLLSCRESTDTRAYKLKHRLLLSEALMSPVTREELSRRSTGNHHLIPNLEGSPRGLLIGRTVTASRMALNNAATVGANEKGYCLAQIPFKIHNRAIELGRTPGRGQFPINFVRAAEKRFGSWGAACREAGCEPNISTPALSKAALVDALLDFYVLNKRLPGTKDWGNGRLPSDKPYVKHFGSLSAAYEAAGLSLVAAQRRSDQVMRAVAAKRQQKQLTVQS